MQVAKYVSSKDAERIAEAVGANIEAENAKQIEKEFSLDGAVQPSDPAIQVAYIEYDGAGVGGWDLKG